MARRRDLDSDRRRAALARRRAARALVASTDDLCDEWSAPVRAFYDDPSQLVAALCSRRAGKTRGGNRHFLRRARRTPGGRFLYINSTRDEAQRLAWHGNRADGMAALITQLRLEETGEAKLDANKLTIRFPKIDSWIYLKGADDERGVRKVLGGTYHEVWWDEAQKIPPKLAEPIREVLMPALLDFGGRLRLTGTPSRQMAGLFYDVTRPEAGKRPRNWSVHHWTLLDNPYFGRAVQRGDGRWVVYGKGSNVPVIAPSREAAEARARELRYQDGLLALRDLLSTGMDPLPLDSPIMQREGKGLWVAEDSNYVYAVHKVARERLVYAPARVRTDGVFDLHSALRDLPGEWRDYFFALSVDIGYTDPFGVVIWAWRPSDPTLYEVVSWKRAALTSDEQAAIIQYVRDQIGLAIIVGDAGGSVHGTVKGWSKGWQDRYPIPIVEAEKSNKIAAIELVNNDILGRSPIDGGCLIRLRDDGALLAEMEQVQWATIVTATGRQIEDPTIPNDVTDAGLYGHRHSYHHRFRPAPPPPPEYGSPEWAEREAAELEEYVDDDPEEEAPYH